MTRSPRPSEYQPPNGKLRIIATTDSHAAVLPYDFYVDRPAQGVGLLNLRETIAMLRDTDATTLLVDNGDFLQGTPMSDVIAMDPSWRDSHINPIVEAMNSIRYDAVGLGNHEFNFGLDVLEDIKQQLDCPVLCANVIKTADKSPLVMPWSIFDRTVQMADGTIQPIRIGVLGLAPPQVKTWDALIFGDALTATDIVKTAAYYVPLMKDQGADVIIALCHSGIGAEQHSTGMENAAIPLAAIDGIDALVLGHTHNTFPVSDIPAHGSVDYSRGLIHGKPAVMPGVGATSAGVIDLDLHLLDGRWHVATSHVRIAPAPMSSSKPDLSSLPNIKAAQTETFTYIRTPIGQSDRPLTSYFALVANCQTVQIVADAQREVAKQALVDTEWAALPLLSAAAPFKAGGPSGKASFIDIPAGPLAMRNAAELYLYPNNIAAALMTGTDIVRFLERSAGLFQRIAPNGGAQRIIDLDFPCYNFDVIFGLTYQIDISEPARFNSRGEDVAPHAQRIKNLCYRGQPVASDARFVVATNSYRIGGGGYFFADCPPQIVAETQQPARDAVVDFIRSGKNIGLTTDHVWGFSPVSGATGLFETGEDAPLHADRVKDRRIIGFDRDAMGQFCGQIDLG